MFTSTASLPPFKSSVNLSSRTSSPPFHTVASGSSMSSIWRRCDALISSILRRSDIGKLDLLQSTLTQRISPPMDPTPICLRSGKVGMGIIILDHRGLVVVAKASPVIGCSFVELLEAQACLEGLRLALDVRSGFGV
ncbi:hypothetical protein LWI29_028963 [Acer saccharum]|uniref:RNase H type-1 domain-containing protein n=1 Tax=Acer saccharum TaxID=4024 RepID=A0AA39W789_ACESA|nr:hypothetical protein LWI29_028963 [Acer saccharum]